MMERPVATPTWITDYLGLSPTTVNRNLKLLEEMGILSEISRRKRSRVYSYIEYMRILNSQAEG